MLLNTKNVILTTVYNTQNYWVSGLSAHWLRLAVSQGPKRICLPPHLRTETDLVSKSSRNRVILKCNRCSSRVPINMSIFVSFSFITSFAIRLRKYSHESRGTRTGERLLWRCPAETENYRPDFSSKRAPYINKSITNCG
jgi:hypothetical protein